MLPRQLRVGDLVDDYCPRERRLTDHAIVAMVGDDMRQVRCTACDAEHEYRQGKVPASRRKKPALPAAPPLATAPAPAPPAAPAGPEAPAEKETPDMPAPPAVAAAADVAPESPLPAVPADEAPEPATPGAPHDGPFHRPLIRATLPASKAPRCRRARFPEFTMHKAASAQGHRHGKPFRPGQPGGLHRHCQGRNGGHRALAATEASGPLRAGPGARRWPTPSRQPLQSGRPGRTWRARRPGTRMAPGRHAARVPAAQALARPEEALTSLPQ